MNQAQNISNAHSGYNTNIAHIQDVDCSYLAIWLETYFKLSQRQRVTLQRAG